jgi:hypothetical protein
MYWRLNNSPTFNVTAGTQWNFQVATQITAYVGAGAGIFDP